MSVCRQREMFICELCRRQTDLYYVRSSDQYLCEDCLDDQTKGGSDDNNSD